MTGEKAGERVGVEDVGLLRGQVRVERAAAPPADDGRDLVPTAESLVQDSCDPTYPVAPISATFMARSMPVRTPSSGRGDVT